MKNEPMNYQYSKYFIIFAILLFTFNILDIASTKFVIDRGGFEGNPVARASMQGIGYWWSALVKMIGCLFCIGAMLWVSNRNPLLAIAVLAAVTGMTGAVVYSNILVAYHYFFVLAH